MLGRAKARVARSIPFQSAVSARSGSACLLTSSRGPTCRVPRYSACFRFIHDYSMQQVTRKVTI